MKRIIVFFAALALCASLPAQNKGDISISAFLSGEWGTMKTTSGNSSLSMPTVSGLEIAGEFNYFVVDNLRLSLAIGIPFISDVMGQDGDESLKRRSLGVYFNPNLAYYVKLADRFYYTPEIGLGYELGGYKEDLSSSSSVTGRYNGFYAYGYPLSFEFRVNERIAIGLACGEINWQTYTYHKTDQKEDLFNLYLNKAMLTVRFYL